MWYLWLSLGIVIGTVFGAIAFRSGQLYYDYRQDAMARRNIKKIKSIRAMVDSYKHDEDI